SLERGGPLLTRSTYPRAVRGWSPMVDKPLLEAFRHNAWANATVIDACRGLSDDQLDATAPGTFGSIIRTLRHVVGNEGWFIELLTGELPAWTAGIREAGLDQLERDAAESLTFWEALATDGFDPDRPVHNYADGR